MFSMFRESWKGLEEKGWRKSEGRRMVIRDCKYMAGLAGLTVKTVSGNGVKT